MPVTAQFTATRLDIEFEKLHRVRERENGGDRVVLLDNEGSDWVIYRDDEDDGDGLWLPDAIAEHLQPGEIAIFQTIGHEKLRFLNG